MPAVIEIGRPHALHARQFDRRLEQPRPFHADPDNAKAHALSGVRLLCIEKDGVTRADCAQGQSTSLQKFTPRDRVFHEEIPLILTLHPAAATEPGTQSRYTR